MDGLLVACAQPRMKISTTREEFEAEARRFLRQAQSKAAQLIIFPELAGLMLAPPLISGFKLGFVKRADNAKDPKAGFVSRGLGSISNAAAGALGGGFRGSVGRLIRKKSDDLRDLYTEVFGSLAREYGTAILAGSLYLYDQETDSFRNRAYLFDSDGAALGFQDKFNLSPDEADLASPGFDMPALKTRFGRLGILIGRDALYPELSRLLAMQGADLIVGIAASPGAAQAQVIRSAMALRADENQVYTASCFMLGPNYLSKDNKDEYLGRSALMAPISLTGQGDGVLVQAGTNRTETLIAAELDMEALHNLRETSRFQPRQGIHLGNLGPVLAEMYQQGTTIDEVMAQELADEVLPEPEQPSFRPVQLEEPVLEEVEPETEPIPSSIADALSLTASAEMDEE